MMQGSATNEMQTKIIAAVAGLILIGLWTQLYPVQNAAADQFYLTTQPKCFIAGEPFVKLYPPASGGNGGFFQTAGVTVTKSMCTSAAPSSSPATVDLYTEHNQKLTVQTLTAQTQTAIATLRDNGTWGSQTQTTLFGASSGLAQTNGWEGVLPIVAQYGVITRQVIAIIPVIGVASIVGLSAASLYAYGIGAQDLSNMVIMQVVTLVVYVVGLIFAPEVMKFMNGIFLIFEYERFSINQLYNVVLTLIMGFAPIIYAAGLVSAGGITMFVQRRMRAAQA